MSLIACLSNCVYQHDGYCSLERAVSAGSPCKAEPCVNFIPRADSLQDRGQRLTNIMDLNQL